MKTAIKFFSLVALLSCAAVVRGQQQPAGKMRLTKVEWVGLQRVKEEEVARVSGLSAGQEVDVAALDAAAERLVLSGLVTRVGYNLREAGGRASVTFEVVEAKREGNIPVVFDNFVWFTRDELVAAVQKELPEFDGRASESNSAVAAVTRALERLLAERKIAGEVEYLPQASVTGGDPKHVFSVNGVSLPVCSVNFAGASAAVEPELRAVARQVVGTDYSQEAVAAFADSAVRALYHRRGHLKVRFGEPGAAVAESAACKGGVAVSLPVEEGQVYTWAGAEWGGNAAFPAAELDAALAIRPGEVADAARVERQLREVRKLYGRRGHLAMTWRERREFDDAARRVAFRFDVQEGPQYRMGELVVAGLSDADAARVRSEWKLRPGDAFDVTYVEGFLAGAMPALARAGLDKLKLNTQVRPDAARQAADVTLTFTRD
ncbi:MAG TPA: POTRA domain-containing protein [Pyrinomonadaceae bacterium]|nr:POTRA domain-containing protein [Pyrinomonadaceae bacterium]